MSTPQDRIPSFDEFLREREQRVSQLGLKNGQDVGAARDGGARRHAGLDFGRTAGAFEGDPVGAAGDGEVVFAGGRRGYGNLVILRHGDGSETRYGHLGNIGVRTGTRVSKGAPLGTVGNTGHSFGAHTHFEVWRDGASIDPLITDYMPLFGRRAVASAPLFDESPDQPEAAPPATIPTFDEFVEKELPGASVTSRVLEDNGDPLQGNDDSAPTLAPQTDRFTGGGLRVPVLEGDTQMSVRLRGAEMAARAAGLSDEQRAHFVRRIEQDFSGTDAERFPGLDDAAFEKYKEQGYIPLQLDGKTAPRVVELLREYQESRASMQPARPEVAEAMRRANDVEDTAKKYGLNPRDFSTVVGAGEEAGAGVMQLGANALDVYRRAANVVTGSNAGDALPLGGAKRKLEEKAQVGRMASQAVAERYPDRSLGEEVAGEALKAVPQVVALGGAGGLGGAAARVVGAPALVGEVAALAGLGAEQNEHAGGRAMLEGAGMNALLPVVSKTLSLPALKLGVPERAAGEFALNAIPAYAATGDVNKALAQGLIGVGMFSAGRPGARASGTPAAPDAFVVTLRDELGRTHVFDTRTNEFIEGGRMASPEAVKAFQELDARLARVREVVRKSKAGEALMPDERALAGEAQQGSPLQSRAGLPPLPGEMEIFTAANRRVTQPSRVILPPVPVDPKTGELRAPIAPETYGSRNRLVSTERAEAARARLKQKFSPNRLNAGLDPTVLADLAELGAYHMEAGVRSFPQWSKKMVEEVGDEVKPHLKEIYDHARAQFGSAGQEVDSNIHSTTKAERTPSSTVVSSLWKAGLLTGVRTHLRNIGSTASFQVTEEAARAFGAGADIVASLVTGQRALTGVNPKAFGRSSFEAATKGVREAWQILRNGAADEDLTRLQLDSEINSGNRIIDAYVNTVFRAMGAEDRIFRTFALRRSLEDQAHALALTELRQKKISRSDIRARTRELVARPTEEMQARAVWDADVATFNNDNLISGAIGEARGYVRRKTGPAATLPLDITVPFHRTPTNVIARTLEYSPLGYGKNALQLARAFIHQSMTLDQQRNFSQTFGRASAGSALIALGWYLGGKGLATGVVDDDPSRRERDKAAGRMPMSIRIGNRWHQVGGISPVGNLLALGASLRREATQPLNDESSRTGNLMEIGTHTVTEQPLLKGISALSDALQQPGSKGASFVGNLAGSVIPTVVSDAGGLLDGKRREANSIVEKVESRIPVLRSRLPEAFDVLGRPLESRATAFLDPTLTTTAREANDPVDRELVRLDIGVGRAPAHVMVNDKQVNLTSEQAYDYRRRVGEAMYKDLKRVIESPMYGSLSDEKRRKLLTGAIQNTREKENVQLRRRLKLPKKKGVSVLPGLPELPGLPDLP